MNDRQELEELRRLEQLEAKARGQVDPDQNLPETLNVAGFDTGLKIPKELSAGLVAAGRGFSRVGQGIRAMLPGDNTQLNEQVKQETELFEPLEKKYPTATTIGEIAPYVALPGGPVAMAGVAALEHGTPQERLTRAGMAFAGGKAGQLFGRMLGPKAPEAVGKGADEFFEYGNKWGIPLSAGQKTGSKPLQITESVLANIPGASGVMAKAKDRQFGAFNKAVAETFGADTTKITPEVLGEAREGIGKTIGALSKRNTWVGTQDFGNAVVAVQKRVASELDDDSAKLVNKQIEQIRRAIDPETLTMPGTMYKAIDSQLGRVAKDAKGTARDVLGDLRTALRDAMDKSISPEDVAQWTKARREYFNVNQVADAAASTPGHLSPAQLLMSVNRNQKASRFGGGNELAELARYAKKTLPDQVPNSGTAQRLLYQQILTSPVTAAGLLGGGAYGANQMGVSPVQAAGGLAVPYLLARTLAGKPPSEKTLKALKKSGGLLGIGLADEE